MAQRMVDSMKKISQIVAMPWHPQIGTDAYTVIATVEGIDEEGGWFYGSCSQCSKGLNVVSGAFWCPICGGLSTYPCVRFRLHLRVWDTSGQTTLAMFNQQMEHLIDTSANKLLNQVGIDSHVFPKELGSLTGKSFVFTIKMGDCFNPDLDFHHNRVLRLYEIAPLPSINPSSNRRIKIRRLKKRKTADVGPEDELHKTTSQPCCSAESTCGGAVVAAKGKC